MGRFLWWIFRRIVAFDAFDESDETCQKNSTTANDCNGFNRRHAIYFLHFVVVDHCIVSFCDYGYIRVWIK